jgi:hypothetical protein
MDSGFLMLCDLKAMVRSSALHYLRKRFHFVWECACSQRKRVSVQALHFTKCVRVTVAPSYLQLVNTINLDSSAWIEVNGQFWTRSLRFIGRASGDW